MNVGNRHSDDSGFTLVEVLVAVLILGLLAAVVFPVVIGQVDKADPTAASNDLANVRSGIELFSLDVRPRNPGDLEDLVNDIRTTNDDAGIDGQAFETSDSTSWEGPYIDTPIPSAAADASSTKSTGFDADILNGLVVYDQSAEGVSSTTSGTSNDDFIAVALQGLTSSQFTDLNDQIDGEDESSSETSGKLRVINSNYSDSTFYLATPVNK